MEVNGLEPLPESSRKPGVGSGAALNPAPLNRGDQFHSLVRCWDWLDPAGQAEVVALADRLVESRQAVAKPG
jgi:hypothetical protein